ncbi:hypothetical protein AHAS_Ahas16G0124300 [Arachis hypogaea]
MEAPRRGSGFQLRALMPKHYMNPLLRLLNSLPLRNPSNPSKHANQTPFLKTRPRRLPLQVENVVFMLRNLRRLGKRRGSTISLLSKFYFGILYNSRLVTEALQKMKGKIPEIAGPPRHLQESDGIIKQVKMSVKEAMNPLNRRKIVLKFNSALQSVGDETGIMSGVMGLLGSDYTKFSICEKD